MDHHAAFPSPQQQRKQVRRCVQASSAMEFFNMLTGPELLEVTEAHLPSHRERLYPPTVTLAMFLRQALEEDRSCQRAVNAWAAARAAEGLSPRSIRTGAYCRARQRLPLELVQALTRETGHWLCGRSKDSWRWRGRAVKLIDGTSFSMPDTEANQVAYPQSRNQAQGVGFPLARFAGVICLATGALIDAAVGPFTGKGHGELGLSRGLLSALAPGDVMLADALYCSYFLIATLETSGIDVVFEQHGSRVSDFRRGRRLGPRDHLVAWVKPVVRSDRTDSQP